MRRQMCPKLLITFKLANSHYWIFSAVCWLLVVIKFTKVKAIGIPIMKIDTGRGMSCFTTLAINIPIDEAEKAVRLSVTLLGYIFMCNGTL